MISEIETSIKALAEKAGDTAQAGEAMQLAQAVLNLAHARTQILLQQEPTSTSNERGGAA